MYRVELKAKRSTSLAEMTSPFLMYRVELKVKEAGKGTVKDKFMLLMYRVELKVARINPYMAFRTSFLMYRVELKASLSSCLLTDDACS